MVVNGIKTEGASPIKRDPDLDEEEDKYADEEGELQIPVASHEEAKVWLAKIPKWLWESWAPIRDDEEIELGKIRIYHSPPGQTQSNKMKLILNDLPQGHHAEVPKKYDITMNRQTYNNTVIFSEQDQPGFKSWRPNRVFKREERQPQSAEAYRINKQKKYGSAIPKKVALAGYVAHEMTLTAVENAEYQRLTDARFKKMFAPKRQTTYTVGVDRLAHPAMAAAANFSTFTTAGQRKPIKKKQTEKAVRISQEDLLDALNQCFKEYRYWSLRALKQRTNQPEAYVKTVVEKIATLIRSGPFTMNYRLNDEYERSVNLGGVKEEAAAELDEVEDDDEDDDEDGDDFEDVKMDET